jgi:hypothetical protein
MPTGVLVTVPVPVPLRATVRVKGPPLWLAKVAATETSALIVTVQVPVPLQPPPFQPTKAHPDAGVAVRVTTVPGW